MAQPPRHIVDYLRCCIILPNPHVSRSREISESIKGSNHPAAGTPNTEASGFCVLWYNLFTMEEYKHYSKIINRAADRSFTDKRENLPNISKSAYELIRPDTNKVKRLYALLSFIRKSLPEKVWEKTGVSQAFRDLSHFPLDLEKYQLKQRVGSGFQCDCYLFEPLDKDNNETWVLKVFQNGEDDLSKLESKAKQVNQDYQVMSTWYKEMEGVIPKQVAFIGEHFQLPQNRPALYVLQKFLGNNIKGIAENFNDKEWDEFSTKNPQIKEQLKKFLLITKDNIDKNDQIPDLIGDNNLVVADFDNSPNLFFLDPDLIRKIGDMDPELRSRYDKRLSILYKRAGIN